MRYEVKHRARFFFFISGRRKAGFMIPKKLMPGLDALLPEPPFGLWPDSLDVNKGMLKQIDLSLWSPYFFLIRARM